MQNLIPIKNKPSTLLQFILSRNLNQKVDQSGLKFSLRQKRNSLEYIEKSIYILYNLKIQKNR